MTSQNLRLEEIRNRLDSFKDAGVSWRIQVLNPYTSSSTLMQEQGSHHEKVMYDLITNLIPDLEFLLEHVQS